MSNDLFELRLKGQEGITKILYCTLTGKTIIMLYILIKKTQKTTLNELF